MHSNANLGLGRKEISLHSKLQPLSSGYSDRESRRCRHRRRRRCRHPLKLGIPDHPFPHRHRRHAILKSRRPFLLPSTRRDLPVSTPCCRGLRGASERAREREGIEGRVPPRPSSPPLQTLLQVAIYESGISCFRVGFRCSQFHRLRLLSGWAAPETTEPFSPSNDDTWHAKGSLRNVE